MFSINAQNVGRVGVNILSPKTSLHVAEGDRVLFGKDTLGSGVKLMFLPDLAAFRVGVVNPGASSPYWNRDSIGFASFSAGNNTRAQGFASSSLGGDTESFGAYSFAAGFFTNADGVYSVAQGFNTYALGMASTSLGYECDSNKDFTFSSGFNSAADAIYSSVIGLYCLAESYASISLGSYNIGGGNPDVWINDDPIFEVGIGQSELTRANALTILKDGKTGIITNEPKANLHVKDDGQADIGRIVAVLESSVSNRPILQFSETVVGDNDSGMSIEYDGRLSGGSNKMYINKTGGIPMLTFENSGQVGIGITSPDFALHLLNSSSSGVGRAHSWTTYSDARIKSNILPISYGLETILLLNPVSYTQHNATIENNELIKDGSKETIGLIAQETFEVLPESVIKPSDEANDLWGMDYEKIIPVLVKGMQEQQEMIEELKAELQVLKEALKKKEN